MAIYYGDGSNSDGGNGRTIQKVWNQTSTAYSRSNNVGWLELTNFGVQITPKSNDHKIHIQAQVPVSCYHNGGGTGAEMFINRYTSAGGSTAVWESMVIGRSNSDDHLLASIFIDHIDNPQTTNTITYRLYGRELHGNTSVSFNGALSGNNYGSNQSYLGQIVCTELAT